MKKKKRVVLAFSGGLDTSYCLKYLTDQGLEVHSICVNSGGFSADESRKIEERAQILGSAKHVTMEISEEFYNQCIRFLVYGNVLKHNTYPLSVSAERVFQAIAVADYARKIKADYLAHGSTGAGNDQIRFDMIFHVRAPGIAVLTPVRDQQLERNDELDFLKSKGVPLEWKKMAYSINRGLWGTTIGGKETLTSNKSLPEDAYPSRTTANESRDMEISFRKGQIKSVDGKIYRNPVDAIQTLEKIAEPYGVGRGIHVGDTIIGIKGRVGFEASAPMILIRAHETLEKHVLTKWQIYWKEQLANWYGMMLHEGQYLDPVMRDIEAYLEHSQESVSGTVFIKLHPKHFEVTGIESEWDLMQSGFGQYGETHAAWNGEDVRGLAKMMAVPMMIHESVKEKAGV